MSVSTYQDNYETYPLPTEAELEKAREIIAKRKLKAKLNRSKTLEEARAKFENVRKKIINSLNNQT
jgi:vacuolar-type H+-ATPase subunit H